MPRVSIATRDRARPVAAMDGVSGAAETLAYFDGPHATLHLHLHHVAIGDVLRMEAHGTDRLAYVWKGDVEAGGHCLEPGSSFIVEQEASLDVRAVGKASILIFAPAAISEKGGGHVRLLPRDRVPVVPDHRGTGTTGALHADGIGAGASLWLNENSLAGRAEAPTPEVALRGTHAHPADEIIFIVDGAVRLGNRLYPPGTAIAIAAHTLYGFSPGPEGTRFITFRASRADSIRFATGGDYMESTYFKDIGPIDYLTLV